jgi:hypothetical protein
MGRIIRRTVTITITESWTIVWTDEAKTGDAPQSQAITIVQKQVQTQEEPDEVLQATLTTSEFTALSASAPTATPPTPAAPDAQSDDATAKPGAGRKRKRGRRATA